METVETSDLPEMDVTCGEASDLVSKILTTIVTKPSKVSVQSSIEEDTDTIFLKLHVDPGDVGIVIGKQGKNIHAIQTLLNCLGARDQVRILCKVMSPPGKNGTGHRSRSSVRE